MVTLTPLGKSGVVLYVNMQLAVEAGQPTLASKKRGWEEFTDHVIDVLNEQREHIVFILWGAYAQRKGQRINQRQASRVKGSTSGTAFGRKPWWFFLVAKYFRNENELPQNNMALSLSIGSWTHEIILPLTKHYHPDLIVEEAQQWLAYRSFKSPEIFACAG